MNIFIKYISLISICALFCITKSTSWYSQEETPVIASTAKQETSTKEVLSVEKTPTTQEVSVKKIPAKKTTPIEGIQNKISQEKKLIVLFLTPSCGYCRYIRPLFDEIQLAYESHITFEVINVLTDKTGYKSTFKFDTVPTVIYYKNGKEELRHGSDNKKITVAQMKNNIKNIYDL